MISTEWCSLCNSKPAEGTLTILDEFSQQPVEIPACEECVVKIPSEDWINPDMIKEYSHDNEQ